MMVMMNDHPRDDELDRILSGTEILPSSGFTASVMEAVRREAAAPPPIPFPWKRALPGLVIAGAILGVVVVLSILQLARGAPTAHPPAAWGIGLQSLGQAMLKFGGPWVALALLTSFACMKFSALFVARRT
jgi:hypothetical protein